MRGIVSRRSLISYHLTDKRFQCTSSITLCLCKWQIDCLRYLAKWPIQHSEDLWSGGQTRSARALVELGYSGSVKAATFSWSG